MKPALILIFRTGGTGTLEPQMITALMQAIENPPAAVRGVDVPAIRRARTTAHSLATAR